MPESSRWLFSNKEVRELAGENLPDPFFDSIENDTILSLLRHDIEHYLPDMLLRDLDVFTMSQSFEARAPLLDKELMEFCWQLPMPIKSRGASKQLLADAVRDILPPALLNKPKTGFELPMREWLLRGALRPYLDTLVSGEMKLVSDGFLSGPSVRRIHADFVKGRSHYMKPWSIVALEHWYRLMTSIQIISAR
jgi:asparagine synthase (glutamine-hydrolysing)